jgi:hypothetical protein
MRVRYKNAEFELEVECEGIDEFGDVLVEFGLDVTTREGKELPPPEATYVFKKTKELPTETPKKSPEPREPRWYNNTWTSFVKEHKDDEGLDGLPANKKMPILAARYHEERKGRTEKAPSQQHFKTSYTVDKETERWCQWPGCNRSITHRSKTAKYCEEHSLEMNRLRAREQHKNRKNRYAYKNHRCVVCGENITHRQPHAKYCKECVQNVQKRHKREYKNRKKKLKEEDTTPDAKIKAQHEAWKDVAEENSKKAKERKKELDNSATTAKKGIACPVGCGVSHFKDYNELLLHVLNQHPGAHEISDVRRRAKLEERETESATPAEMLEYERELYGEPDDE